MLAESAGFALLAAISPTALLVMVIFLSSDNPRRIAMLYVVGAVLMTLAMAVTVLVVLHATGLNQPRERTPRYGLRLGLGILALALAGFMIVRARRARTAGDRTVSDRTVSDRAGGEGTAGSEDGKAARLRRQAHRAPAAAHRLPGRPVPFRALSLVHRRRPGHRHVQRSGTADRPGDSDRHHADRADRLAAAHRLSRRTGSNDALPAERQRLGCRAQPDAGDGRPRDRGRGPGDQRSSGHLAMTEPRRRPGYRDLRHDGVA